MAETSNKYCQLEQEPQKAKTQVEWRVSSQVEFQIAQKNMLQRAQKLATNNNIPQLVWLLEHPHIISLGRSAKKNDILIKNNIPIVHATRGGQTTYHGPGQRIVYLAIRMQNHTKSVREFVQIIQKWAKNAIEACGPKVHTDKNAIGLWVGRKKIAAFGLRIASGIVTHGIAINHEVELKYFKNIIPCGMQHKIYSTTSIANEGYSVSQEKLDRYLKKTCPFL